LLHLADHDELGCTLGKGDEIAAAHLALDLQAEPLQVALYRWIEVGFQDRCPFDEDLDQLGEGLVNVAWMALRERQLRVW
jgi:hypothetical protein